MPETQILTAMRLVEGAGFEVQRVIPAAGLDALGPFILLDHIGPVSIPAGEAVGAPTHPHAGIETLSYFIEGSGLHHDSLGNRAITGPGEVQWMRAGRGIIHDEGPDETMLRDGGRSHMVQLWLNMPGRTKFDEPAYRTFRRDTIPVVGFAAGGSLRVIAGDLASVTGPLETNANPLLAHGSLPAGGQCDLPLPPLDQYGLFVLVGDMTVDGARANADQLVVLTKHSEFRARADSAAEFLLLGGDRVDEPLVRRGPFVANNNTDMDRIVNDYQRGAFGRIQKDS